MYGNENNKFGLHIDVLIIDAISLIISFTLSYVIKFGNFEFITSENWMPLLIIMVLLNFVIGACSVSYNNFFKRPYYEEIINSLLITFYNLLIETVILYVMKIGAVFSRQTILTMYILYFVLSAILKCIWKKLVLSGKIKFYTPKKQSMFLICDGEDIKNILHNVSAVDFVLYDIKAVGLLSELKTKKINGIEIVENTDKFIDFIVKNNINDVFIATDKYKFNKDDLLLLIKNGVCVHFDIDGFVGIKSEDYSISNVGVYKTLDLGKFSFSSGQVVYIFVKRIFDIIIGFIGSVLLLPVALCVKFAYLIYGDRAKILYRQQRIGKNGKVINIYKFRTMVENADEILPEILKDEVLKREWEENQKLKNDPRITKVGSFLRKTSIDEFPQFINVLKGDMSLVGPRPLVKGELEKHNGLKIYNKVCPGITGWWGCNGRSDIDYTERLELEYYYVKNISVYLDFLCILRTVLTVLRRDGAE